MRVYKILLETRSEGPGLRACIWVQGCKHACKGCFAKHLWNYDGGTRMSVAEVMDEIGKSIDKIDGITFLGGEPFDQAKELSEIAKYVRAAGKNVITFTGYTYEYLQESGISGAKELLDNTDLLADGPFVEELLNYDRPLLGSSNQRFIFLTDTISPKDLEKYKNSFEVRISPQGRVQINGMGDLQKLNKKLGIADGERI